MLQPSRTHQTPDVLTSTASIQFANGSAQDIVKIEGGISYKEMMRWLSNTNDTKRAYRLYKMPSSWSQRLVHAESFQNAINLLSSMWPTQPPPLTPQAHALLWMLKALKAATEACIEQPVQYIVITNPLPLESSPTYHSAIHSASSTLGLRLGSTHFLNAQAAAEAYETKGTCDLLPDSYDDYASDHLFVAINYNHCDIYEELRTVHDTTLGSGSDIPRAERHDAIKAALGDIVKPPYVQGTSTYKAIRDIVLLGESTNNEVLHAVLEEVLSRPFINLNIGASKERLKMVNPLFAASRGAAKACLNCKFAKNHNGMYGST
ncbi:hypothetical protein D6C91_04855 [Aureobasidium pullulans]|uniref:Actin-like ATPase domain-containing protein n=1 Tax=Aureobasidium pullulans TaxID=5580 RepID=A0A4S9T8U7_AURPU|nr:hypothetical protein D6C91_04855 [Aureobasidium pullulans]